MRAGASQPLERRVDVCVLGGGPAGSVIARRLGELGHAVILIARGASLHGRWAESLPPSTLAVLDSVGLHDCAERSAFLREDRSVVDWEPGGPHVRSNGDDPTLLVDRTEFDGLLRLAASRSGVELITPASAVAARRLGRGAWIIPVTAPRGPLTVRAGFLVDARGKRSGGAVERAGNAPRTVALSACWERGKSGPGATRIEARAEDWLWGNPLPEGLYAATVFLDPARIAGLGIERRSGLYRRIVVQSRLIGSLASGRLVGPVRVRDAASRIAGSLIGPDFIRVGEAAFSIDPLSSQGIQAAIVSAVQGAAAVHTLLTNPTDPDPPLTFYRERQQSAAAGAAKTAARLYGLRAGKGTSAFWRRRSVAPVAPVPEDRPLERSSAFLPHDLCLSSALRLVEVPALSGALIRRIAALDHPGLARPVAFLGGTEVAQLASAAMQVAGRDQILSRWARHVHPEIGREIMAWMYSVGIVVRQSTEPARTRGTP